jgi:small GTP-binding protein
MIKSRKYRIVIMGAEDVGKTTLATQFVKEFFVEKYDPTIEDLYRKEICINKYKKVIFEIIDTAGTVSN